MLTEPDRALQMSKRDILVTLTRYRFLTDPKLIRSVVRKATALFEDLCVPGMHTMPDDPEMFKEETDLASAMWAQLTSMEKQAEQGGDPLIPGHHDQAELFVSALVATAKVLRGQPFNKSSNKRRGKFYKLTGFDPVTFSDVFS